MPRIPSQTVTTVRIWQSQADALKSLPIGVSQSILLRILLQLFLDGKIPEAHALILQEKKRVEASALARQFSSKNQPQRKKGASQNGLSGTGTGKSASPSNSNGDGTGTEGN